MNKRKRIAWIIAVFIICILAAGCGKAEAKNFEYPLGFVCGILLSLLIVRFLVWFVRKLGGRIDPKCRKDSYDERQLLARGQAYKSAFFTLLFYIVAVSVLNDMLGISMFMSFCGVWIGVCLSIMVFVVNCIIKDAYMSLYENARGVIIVFSIVGIMNIGIGIPVILQGHPFQENGAISLDWTNLIVGVLFFIILIVFCGKLLYNKRHSEEDDEE